MKSRSALFTSFFTTVLLAAGPASAAWFMKMDTVPGESGAPGQGEVQLLSWSFGATSSQSLDAGQALPSARSGGPGTMMIWKRGDAASPLLKRLHTQRRQITKVVIEGRKPGDPQPYIQLTLNDCMISSYQTGGSAAGPGDRGPEESITFVYGKLGINDHNQPKPGTGKTLGGPDTIQQKK